MPGWEPGLAGTAYVVWALPPQEREQWEHAEQARVQGQCTAVGRTRGRDTRVAAAARKIPLARRFGECTPEASPAGLP